jgi:adenosine deaminase
LIQKYQGQAAVGNLAALKERFVYRDFSHFIETWSWKNQFLRAYEDFSFIAEQVARDFARQNIRYSEMFYSPSLFQRHGLSAQRITAAVREGLSRVGEIEVALIADLVRDYGPEREFRTLQQLLEVKDLGVIGIGIGGTEPDFPPEPFADLFEQARQFGFRTTAHAGEAAGPASLWGAIRALRVERIGHGTRAWEDEALITHLAQTRIPLEMCPVSNFRTGVVKSLAGHPIGNFFRRGLRICVNTDDPQMFHTSLAEEYRQLVQDCGFSKQEIRALVLAGIESSWLSPEKKGQLIDQFQNDIAFQTDRTYP